MKIVVFASDVPYPANRGGRADVWRRILAFRALGHEVMLVNLFEATGRTAPTEVDLVAIDAVVQSRFSFPMKRSAWRTAKQLLGMWHTPWHAATRLPDPDEDRLLADKVARFRPDLLWLEGPWFGPLVERVSTRCRVPFAYRSHNVEHLYLWGQAKAAVRWRDQLAWRLACVGVERLQLRLMRGACGVFEISTDDLQHWRRLGVARQHWLPPLPELAVQPAPAEVVPSEVLFLGNLVTPNNVRGVEFLVKSVWPRVLAVRPSARLRVVGSNPTQFVRQCIESAVGVELCANVPDPLAHLLGARVLVNPVMTGSGVQLKTLDMLLTDAPVVSTRQGLRGLPPEVAASVSVCDQPGAFAEAILQGLLTGLSPQQRSARSADQSRFSVRGLDAVLRTAGLISAASPGQT